MRALASGLRMLVRFTNVIEGRAIVITDRWVTGERQPEWLSSHVITWVFFNSPTGTAIPTESSSR